MASFGRSGRSHIRNGRKLALVCVLSLVSIGAMLTRAASYYLPETLGKSISPNFGRRLLSDNWLTNDECDTEFELLGNGALAVIIYILAILYDFLALAIVVDGYFVRSIEVILTKLKISEDLAGAIFMAAGTSAAELFSNVIDTFIYRSNIGFGVIYGTVLFNIFFGVGYAAFVCPSGSKSCDWRVMSRDTTWYLFSIVLIVIFIWDSKVEWYESFILMIAYPGYALSVIYQAHFSKWLCDPCGKVIDERVFSSRGGFFSSRANGIEDEDQSKVADRKEAASVDNVELDGISEIGDNKTAEVDLTVDKVHVHTTADEDGDLDTPAGPCGKVLHCLGIPIDFMFYWTIPDSGTAEKPTEGIRYIGAFLVAVIWIAVLSFLMVKLATSIGCLIGVGPVLLGTTFLAWGTSIPDSMSTIIAARKGEGAIAVSNTLGSNIFDMQIAIGLPWFIFSLAMGEPYPLDHGDLTGPIIFLILSAVMLHFGLSFFGWKLRKRLGALLLATYVIFIIYVFCEEFV